MKNLSDSVDRVSVPTIKSLIIYHIKNSRIRELLVIFVYIVSCHIISVPTLGGITLGKSDTKMFIRETVVSKRRNERYVYYL